METNEKKMVFSKRDHMSKKPKIDQPKALPAATSSKYTLPKVSREKKIKPSQTRRDAVTKESQEDLCRETSSESYKIQNQDFYFVDQYKIILISIAMPR